MLRRCLTTRSSSVCCGGGVARVATVASVTAAAVPSSSLRGVSSSTSHQARDRKRRPKTGHAQQSGNAVAPAPRVPKHGAHTRPTIPTFEHGMLAREFISSSLYQSGAGYFNSAARVFRSNQPAAMSFNDLAGRTEYYTRQQSLYGEFDDCWLTPVEVFKPFYAQAIARWIVETRRRDLGEQSVPEMINQELDGAPMPTTNPNALASELAEAAAAAAAATATPATPTSSPPLVPLRIMEMGGGNGTCALGILDYLERHYPELYAQTEYTIVELSEYMIETQRETLAHHLAHHMKPASTVGGIASSPRVRLLNMSIIDWREVVADETVFLIGLEVLDNMPHDRLRETREHGLQQVHVVAGNPNAELSNLQQYTEQIGPVTDPWIIEYGQYWMQFNQKPAHTTLWEALSKPTSSIGLWWSQKSSAAKQRLQIDNKSVWFPTTSLQFLHILKHYLPRHHLLLADFSHLPSTVEGALGPVVASKSSMSKGATVDYDTYLVEQGKVDIFFPTDFQALQYVYERVCRGKTHDETQASLETPANIDADATEAEADAVEADADTLASDASSPTSATTPPVVIPRVLSQYDFMQRYSKPSEKYLKTRDGWNPICQDYLNFHFFLT